MATNAKKLTIISAGQSNIDGRVPSSKLPAYLSLPLAGCHYCSDKTPQHEQGIFQEELKESDLSDHRWGFDLITYYYLLHQSDCQDLHVIKWTEGGTSIDPTGDGDNHWTTHFDELADQSHSLLLGFTNLIKTCQQVQHNHLDIKAMLWHQGEADRASYSKVAAENYYQNLKDVFAYCRQVVGNSELPIICGTVSHNSKQYDAQVEKATIQVASEDPNIHLIDMQNGQLLDDFHFNAASSELFGKRVYNTLIDEQIVTGKRLADVTAHVY